MPLRTPLSVFGIWLFVLGGCDSTGSSLQDLSTDLAVAEDLAEVARDAGESFDLGPGVTCGASLPGPPLKSSLVEAQPGYAEELAALDLSTLPSSIDFSKESSFFGSLINYMVGRTGGATLSTDEVLRSGGLGRAVLAAFAKGQNGRADVAFLRRGLYYFYPCSRPLPASLSALQRRYGDYHRWYTIDLACSRAKNGPRRLYEDPAQGVYVAETLVGGSVRETEVLFTGLRSDGQIDFAVYTDTGLLSDRSTFATSGGSVTSASPYTCASCHFDPVSGFLNRRFPDGTGAGCR